ncbi:hypothetical protein G7Y89_g13684 [Cudoniella acicularis]|uniref:RING-type domain-containing protein n=1 Tax=Cudoniella acicularis TaxID=354080 RepID=A0A8H4RA69_9HELO|nr:hypothetical protein G7Y89_g13684 [Cudoniella acicularis]
MTLAEVSTKEDRARGDRAMALRISGEDLGAEDIEGLKGAAEGIENTCMLEGSPPTRSIKESDSEDFARPSASYIQGRHDAPRRLSPYMVDCVACGDAFQLSGLVRCPCGDLYCPECLKSLFVRATTNETLFLPRCYCQTIPLSAIEAELSDELLSTFNNTTIEFRRQIIPWPPRNVAVVWWRSDNFKQIMSATILVAGRDRRAIATKDTNVRSTVYDTRSTFSGAATATLWLVKSVEGTESERFPSFGAYPDLPECLGRDLNRQHYDS